MESMVLISRVDAKRLGLGRYFTGDTCQNGHIDLRKVSDGRCLTCLTEKQRRRKEYFAQWYINNRDRVLQQQKIYPRRKEVAAKVRAKYKDKRKESSKKYNKYSYKTESKILNQRKYRLNNKAACSARDLIKDSFRRKGWKKNLKSVLILGCSLQDFRLHIERQFLPGMTWDNRSMWHIDHIVPMATAKTEQDVIALNHFTNLRPLWAIDNLKKGSKVEYLL